MYARGATTDIGYHSAIGEEILITKMLRPIVRALSRPTFHTTGDSSLVAEKNVRMCLGYHDRPFTHRKIAPDCAYLVTTDRSQYRRFAAGKNGARVSLGYHDRPFTPPAAVCVLQKDCARSCLPYNDRPLTGEYLYQALCRTTPT